jgi:ATP-dependent DNA helicase RecG
MDLETPVTYLKGVGPQRAKLLAAKGIETVEDLLYYMPFRYEDRSNVKGIAQLAPGETATVVGEISSAGLFRSRKSAVRIFEVRLKDSSGSWLACKWFRGDYLESIFQRGQQVAFYGKIEWDHFEGGPSMMHPEYEILSGDDDTEAQLHVGRVVPIYEAAGRLNTRALRGIIHRALEEIPAGSDPLPEKVRETLKLPERSRALRETHFPHSIHSPADDVGEVEGLRGPMERLVPGQLDQVADQGRQLLDLCSRVGEDLIALGWIHAAFAVGECEQLQVGPQAGERSTQLVPGVGNKSALAIT